MAKITDRNKAPRQKDIASLLGISRGSVDRALHNRSGISEKTKNRIIRKAKELGYSPNKIAQFLVTKKNLNIAMITPSDPLWSRVKQGTLSFLSEIGRFIVKTKWHVTNVHNPDEQIEIFKNVVKDKFDGIAIAPADPDMLKKWIDKSTNRGIPVVTLNTDSPLSKRICYIGQNTYMAGRMAGELMVKFLHGESSIIIITAFKNVFVHKTRLNAFREIIKSDYKSINILDVFENHDSNEETYTIIKDIFKRKNEIKGIFFTTGNGPFGAVKALKELGLEHEIKIVCFDFFSDTIRLLKEGIVTAAIGEDPFGQGYYAIKVLYEYIINGSIPEGGVIYTKTHIGIGENIGILTREDIYF